MQKFGQKAKCWQLNACESSCTTVWHELRTRRGFGDHAETERTVEDGTRHKGRSLLRDFGAGPLSWF